MGSPSSGSAPSIGAFPSGPAFAGALQSSSSSSNLAIPGSARPSRRSDDSIDHMLKRRLQVLWRLISTFLTLVYE
jgi:hypothetical protein